MPPARQQIDKATLDAFLREKRPEGGTYNIWHHRYSGLERDWSKKGAKAKFRCDPARDSGSTAGSRNPNAYFCLYFAKGMCAQGAKCSMWHRVPTVNDEIETTVDCFGRDKFSDFRQDMGGVGGFSTTNKALYVGRINNVTEQVVRKHFEPWGEIARIHVLRHRGVAFVDYKSRASAEFAKEAMMNQSMDANEIINVRWATETQLQKDRVFQDMVMDQPTLKVLAEGRMAAPDEDSHEVVTDERQHYESELPAEFTAKKRTMEDTGLDDIKRQKRLTDEDNDATHDTEYTLTNDPRAAHYAYTAEQQQEYPYQSYHQHAHPTLPPVPSSSSASSLSLSSLSPSGTKTIIPQNVLQSLKQLSGSKDLTIKSAPSKKSLSSSSSSTGLGGLAGYGSDSDSDSE